MRSAVLAATLLAAALLLPAPAGAQLESREGIALQNQILQLRQEVEQLRRAGAAGLAAPARPPAGGAVPQSELVGRLLDRVASLEEEVRRLRGRVEEAEFRAQQQGQAVEKLQVDMDFRLQQLEGQGGARPAPVTRPSALPPRPGGAAQPAAAPPIAAPPATAPPNAAPRPPERAIADGRTALARRDYAAAETAAREALAARGSPRATDAGILLGDALTGRRDFAGAALAYNDAYTRSRRGPRAPEALVGLANSFTSLGNRREACETLNELRSNFPTLRPPLPDRVAEARRRAGCR